MANAAQSQGWNDGQQDPSQINPGTKPDASQPIPPHNNPDAVEHAQLASADRKEGGKQMGLVHAPVTSMHPTSAQQGNEDAQPKNFRIVDKANVKLSHYIHEQGHHEFAYPFSDLEVSQGLFIPVGKNDSTDNLMNVIHKQVDQYRKQNSEIERDENGDDCMEDVAINVKKRNEDGTVQLDGDTPRMTIRAGFRPKLIGPSFAVKAVVKGDKITAGDDGEEADSDGVLVIRMG